MLRPLFLQRSNASAEAVTAALGEALRSEDASCTGRIREGRIEVVVRDEAPHFWAPELRARIVEDEDSTRIEGYFAPKADTWTMFVAIYAATVFSTGIGVVFGLAQWQLGSSPWALWSLPVGAFAIFCVRLGAHIGQRWGADNIQTLRDFIKDSVGQI